jgi:prepilin-type N-terminal cleavage/methylation domain-containing protein/prepilin-type processing-associated H-X9-DG protein
MKRSGFTLIELLVVMAIVAILAGILFPVLARCRRAAQQSVCISNVRQIGMGMRMYVEDYDATFPMGAYPQGQRPHAWQVTWHDEITGYLRGQALLFCPLAPAGSGYRVSYGCNPWVSRWITAAADSQVLDATRTVYAAEKENGDWPACPPSLKSLTPYYQPLAGRHDGYLSLVFCDGHARSLPVGQAEGPVALWQF